MSAFRDCIVLVQKVKSNDGKLQTQEFLDVCRQVLPIVDLVLIKNSIQRSLHTTIHPYIEYHFTNTINPHLKSHDAAKMGTGFALVKSDVGGNINRLADRAATQPNIYNPDIYQMIRDEVKQGTHMDSSSCTKGLLWLKRAMQFILALLHKLDQDRSLSLSEAASEAYYATLQQYHGWIVTGTFTVALKLAPSRHTFLSNVGGSAEEEEECMKAMNQFCIEFGSLLNELHQFLDENGLDDPTKV